MQSKSDDPNPKPRRKPSWAVRITVYTLFISLGMTLISNVLLEKLPVAWAIVILLVIVLVGICADVLGVAVTSASEGPFLAMASKRIRGAKSSIWMVRNAERVANICNDVIGDICGIVSGSTGAAISAVLILRFQQFPNPELIISAVLSAVIAACTVGGKAAGKRYAIKNCIAIVLSMGKFTEMLKIRRRTGK
ncbi:MAG: hypothetical protein PHD32_06075 [Eubacteriales bacterium]|nr:hypothetical protein [Eubacteriales bacterium]